jgi:MinD superfamily P-loop ATPase
MVPPGIGCPVISSITGADAVLVVTEPTVSGEHDLKRVLSLTGHFRIPSYVCVNKWDLNKEVSERIEKLTLSMNAKFSGKIRYDMSVTKAQIAGVPVTETDAPSANDIRELWQTLNNELNLSV